MAYIRQSIFRRTVSLFLTILLLLSAENSLADRKLEKSITIGIQCTKTVTIRPLEPQERDMISIYNIMYESLLTIDDDYMPQGCLAKSWEENNSGKTWIFHLRDDVTFSDGTLWQWDLSNQINTDKHPYLIRCWNILSSSDTKHRSDHEVEYAVDSVDYQNAIQR